MATRYQQWTDGSNDSQNTSSADETGADDSIVSTKDDTPVPNPTTEFMVGLSTALNGTRGISKARIIAESGDDDEDTIETSQGTLTTWWAGMDKEDMDPQTKWQAALYDVKKSLGKRQKNHNPFAMSDYMDDDGNVISKGYNAVVGTDEAHTIESAPFDEGLLAFLTEQLGEEGYVAGIKSWLPAFDGEPLPMLVESEEELQDALALLEQIPEEPAVASSTDSTTSPSEGDDEKPSGWDSVKSAAKGETPEPQTDGDHPDPAEFTVPELRKRVSAIDDLSVIEAMLTSERANENRSTAIDRLEERQRALQSGEEPEEDPAEEPEPKSAAASDDLSREEKMVLAQTLIDNGRTYDEAIEEVGL